MPRIKLLLLASEKIRFSSHTRVPITDDSHGQSFKLMLVVIPSTNFLLFHNAMHDRLLMQNNFSQYLYLQRTVDALHMLYGIILTNVCTTSENTSRMIKGELYLLPLSLFVDNIFVESGFLFTSKLMALINSICLFFLLLYL
jgi:hypothetical protein